MTNVILIMTSPIEAPISSEVLIVCADVEWGIDHVTS